MFIIRSLLLFLSSRRAVFFLMEVWVMDTSLSTTCKMKINQVIKLHRENITLIFALISSNTCHKLTRSCSLGPKLFSNEWYSSQRDYTVLHAVVKTCRYRFRNVVVKECCRQRTTRRNRANLLHDFNQLMIHTTNGKDTHAHLCLWIHLIKPMKHLCDMWGKCWWHTFFKIHLHHYIIFRTTKLAPTM